MQPRGNVGRNVMLAAAGASGFLRFAEFVDSKKDSQASAQRLQEAAAVHISEIGEDVVKHDEAPLLPRG